MRARQVRNGQRDSGAAFFDEIYLRLHEPFFTEENSRREVAAVRELLGLPFGSRILDVPCGWGRHTSLLATAGHAAFGADSSFALLSRARRGRRRRGTPPCYAAADLRTLPFADSSFDGVINICSNLGLFLNDRDDLRALREMRRVLIPGGRFLLETMHRDDVVRAYAERDRWTLPDGTRVEVQRRFDAVTGISHEHLRWRRGHESGEKVHALRLRTATEIARLLRAAGFRDVVYYGGWRGEPFDARSERLIAAATRSNN